MFRVLSRNDKESMQTRGYMFEHLLCLYSGVSEMTVLYDESFPVFFNGFGEADVILFGFDDGEADMFKCVEELRQLPIDRLNIISPTPFNERPNVRLRYVDWDFHVELREFDFGLRGSKYRNIRHSLRKAEEIGYNMRISRKFTSRHTYILSRHLTRHRLDAWDYEELLSLERFFREHDHGLMMEVYKDNRLLGFDVIDFFEDNRIMVVPLGMYLESPYVSDFMMLENLKFAKNNGYESLDLGPTCRVAGLRRFKEKWLGTPKFKLYVQVMRIRHSKTNGPSALHEELEHYFRTD
jgi:hypothetical protein